MLALSLKTEYGDLPTLKRIVSDGLSEERKKILYALDKTSGIIKNFETKYNLSSEEFLKKFKKAEIDDNGDSFEWWAELKVIKELEEKLEIIEDIEICQ
ncbi:MAG: hypothetical protein ACM3SY_00555 [Candidatus Omnitrophota bacterium]